MRDKKDNLGRIDWNSDGVTGYTQGANPRSNWITDNLGKTIIIMVAVMVLFGTFVTIAANNEKDDKPRTQGDEQNAVQPR